MQWGAVLRWRVLTYFLSAWKDTALKYKHEVIHFSFPKHKVLKKQQKYRFELDQLHLEVRAYHVCSVVYVFVLLSLTFWTYFYIGRRQFVASCFSISSAFTWKKWIHQESTSSQLLSSQVYFSSVRHSGGFSTETTLATRWYSMGVCTVSEDIANWIQRRSRPIIYILPNEPVLVSTQVSGLQQIAHEPRDNLLV